MKTPTIIPFDDRNPIQAGKFSDHALFNEPMMKFIIVEACDRLSAANLIGHNMSLGYVCHQSMIVTNKPDGGVRYTQPMVLDMEH